MVSGACAAFPEHPSQPQFAHHVVYDLFLGLAAGETNAAAGGRGRLDLSRRAHSKSGPIIASAASAEFIRRSMERGDLRVIATGGLIAARDFPSEAFSARPDRDCMNPGQRFRLES